MLNVGGLYKIKPKNIHYHEGIGIHLPVIGVLVDFNKITYIKSDDVLIYLGMSESVIVDDETYESFLFNTPLFLFDSKKISMSDLNKPLNEQEYLYEEVVSE